MLIITFDGRTGWDEDKTAENIGQDSLLDQDLSSRPSNTQHKLDHEN
jgi:hypothetical protein